MILSIYQGFFVFSIKLYYLNIGIVLNIFLNYYFLYKILRGGVSIVVKSLHNHRGWAFTSAWWLYCPFLSVVQCITSSHEVPLTNTRVRAEAQTFSQNLERD